MPSLRRGLAGWLVRHHKLYRPPARSTSGAGPLGEQSDFSECQSFLAAKPKRPHHLVVNHSCVRRLAQRSSFCEALFLEGMVMTHLPRGLRGLACLVFTPTSAGSYACPCDGERPPSPAQQRAMDSTQSDRTKAQDFTVGKETRRVTPRKLKQDIRPDGLTGRCRGGSTATSLRSPPYGCP